ncbi:hypothetical protein SAMN05192574_101346 [Mucilaginibacter gossypiicola]|uniref:Uncharacterized protein n=1 Tax=Mucilaginibacter gossypiicola TaxID=551995 RepID=A0A1H8A3U6_9SPHI|nr:hypothetical protein [Mucilaginibacter gossypiicola]SEM65370.1 hypothetical protein SAMN05192574_101346 [Mucilaginibacter gossypiicola]
MAKTKLDPTEFAIQVGATFDFQENGTIVKVNSDGTIAITLNFVLSQCATCAIRTSGDISDINTAVFIKDSANSLNLGGGSKVKKLSLGENVTTGQFSLGTDRNDVFLITEATKGRQGGS